MKVWVTLDMIDGSKSVARGPLNLDEIPLAGALLYLNQADVAGVTFTRADVLQKLAKLEEGADAR